MTDEALTEMRRLRQAVSELMACMSPWLTTDDMCRRYNCTPRTLNNMERDGRIPFRASGRWSRAEVMQYEGNGKKSPIILT